MQAYIVDWLNLLARWAHLVTGVAWIGASFYFVWLDNHLRPPLSDAGAHGRISGEVWAVHGGGFYHAEKFAVAPATLPEPLHWFKWEAYTTWLSGVFLLALVYWYGAEIYLIDPHVLELSKPVAIGLGVLSLVGGWMIYDLLCRSVLAADDRRLGLAIFVFVAVAAYALCQVFSGRGAYIHFGAMLGTIMVANVFFVIMPGQRELVAACRDRRAADTGPALKAKQRSLHNTYFTLPVLFAMISNHYAATYGHAYNWLVLIALSMAGALIRVWFVQRHTGRPSPWPMAGAALVLLGVAVAIAPATAPATDAVGATAARFTEVRDILRERCSGCHASVPSQVGFSAPPKGVVFDTVADILRQAPQIHQQAVLSRAMPIGNLTRMTDAERALLDAWFRTGAGAE